MLCLGKIPPQLQIPDVILHTTTIKIKTFPLFSKTQFSFRLNRDCRFRLHGNLAKNRHGFSVHVSQNAKKGEKSQPEMEGFDQDDEFLEEEEDLIDGEEELSEDEDDEETFIPLLNMKNWLANKPRGFGEDKVYDTSIEDKLMEEIEQSRTAQLANINKLKHNPITPVSKKVIKQQQTDPKEEINGFKVRLLNLPTKKNVHRDLKSAFKEVPGIIDIAPVVSGNKKTRDPICKGLAFVYFKQESDARGFVESFSGQSISFGKVQKQIKCVMDTSLSKPSYVQSSEESRLTVAADAQSQTLDMHSLNDDESSKHEVEDEILESVAHLREIGEDSETRRHAESGDIDDDDDEDEDEDDKEARKKKSVVKSSSSKQKGGSKKEEKLESKRKKEKVLKFNVHGSASRLRIKEKQVLTGVFSKYGATTSLAIQQSINDCSL